MERYKARLAAKRYSQTASIDYPETFSPMVKMVMIRIVIALAATKNWCIYQIDVYNSFLKEISQKMYSWKYLKVYKLPLINLCYASL